MVLGARLRRLREGRGVSREVAGWQIRASESKISRLELGRVGFKERDVADLLTLYGVDDAGDRAALLSLAREANSPGWWHGYGDVLPPWFASYVGLESAASVIRTYEVQFVPGLLQTPDYARAVVLLGHPDAPETQVRRRVDLRMRRQRVLTGDRPPRLWAVVDEAVLRRPIGGPEVLRGQLEALLAVTRSASVTLQVLPFDQGGHAAAGGAFSILRFADDALPDVVYTEQLTGALYLDKRDDVDQYAAAMEQVCLQALPPQATADVLAGLLRDLPAER